ncbi:hypothetical protein B7494_g356 [Chlorociboria aeruginascens]|nr:hypothetical protein B7494_g356 [Chlorociboria aeruginascens]
MGSHQRKIIVPSESFSIEGAPTFPLTPDTYAATSALDREFTVKDQNIVDEGAPKNGVDGIEARAVDGNIAEGVDSGKEDVIQGYKN